MHLTQYHAAVPRWNATTKGWPDRSKSCLSTEIPSDVESLVNVLTCSDRGLCALLGYHSPSLGIRRTILPGYGQRDPYSSELDEFELNVLLHFPVVVLDRRGGFRGLHDHAIEPAVMLACQRAQQTHEAAAGHLRTRTCSSTCSTRKSSSRAMRKPQRSRWLTSRFTTSK